MKHNKRAIEAVRTYKERVLEAKSKLPDGVGQQDVILAIIRIAPELDSLAFSTRWRNAWYAKVSDPQITELLEQVVPVFIEKERKKTDRLRRQKLKRV